MRIGIDIKCLRYNNSGIGRYLRSMLDALQRLDQHNEYVLFSPAPIEYALNNPKWKLKPCKSSLKLPGILWQQFTLPKYLKEEGIQIFWGPEQTMPLKKIRGMVKFLTVHDFVYKRYPETMKRSVLWINRHYGKKAIEQADQILCISDFTRGELFQIFPKVNQEKVQVVSNGVSADFLQEPVPQNERREQILFVGSLEPRKNLKNLLSALEILHHKGIRIPLMMTGPEGWKNQSIKNMIEQSPMKDSIRHLGYVSNEELKELYRTSTAVVFPSLYEGFGLPVIEALACKTPVLTSKGSVMEGIAGTCGIYFDPNSPESIASTLDEFWTNPEKRNYLEPLEIDRQALIHYFNWDNWAKILMRNFAAYEGGH